MLFLLFCLKVGADGANSMVRKQMQANHFALSYNQMGLIATVKLSECDDNFVAWQRFLPNGVIALLPLSENLSSIVWSTDAKHFKQLMQLNEIDFVDAVNNAFVRFFTWFFIQKIFFGTNYYKLKIIRFVIIVTKIRKKFGN